MSRVHQPDCGRCGRPRRLRCVRPDCELPDDHDTADAVGALMAGCLALGFLVGLVMGYASDPLMKALAGLLEVL